jgi:signal transduction histidine kinase
VETDFDPAILFQSTFDLIGPKKLSGVQIKTDVPAKRFLIHCDQLQLQQVLVNIIINAIYAMDKNESGKELTVSLFPAAKLSDSAFTVPPGIKVNSTEKKDYCCIAVADNGSGMDKETVSKIFEPFFTTKPQGEGSGMGLSMAYGIITNCGGWISVESTPGEGSTFRLLLPDVTPNKEI